MQLRVQLWMVEYLALDYPVSYPRHLVQAPAERWPVRSPTPLPSHEAVALQGYLVA